MAVREERLKPIDHDGDGVVEMTTVSPKLTSERESIVVRGHGSNRVLKPEDKIYNLCDVFEEGKGASLLSPPPGKAMEEGVRKIVLETTERIARELIPDIAERVIREEIEKMKHSHSGEVCG